MKYKTHYFVFTVHAIKYHDHGATRMSEESKRKRTLPHSHYINIERAIDILIQEYKDKGYDRFVITNIYYCKGSKYIGKIKYNAPSFVSNKLSKNPYSTNPYYDDKTNLSVNDYKFFKNNGVIISDSRLMEQIRKDFNNG